MASQRNAPVVSLDKQELPATDTQNAPADDTQKPATDTQETPADKQETPADDTQKPADNTQELPATDTQNAPADTTQKPADDTQNAPADKQETPADEDPYAGLTPEQKEVRILEEEACEAQLKYKLAMDAANARKAEIAKQQKLLDDYYALIALVTVGDEALAASLAVNKQAIITCLQEQRIRVGAPQPIPQHGSIGIHQSNNGSRVIDGSTIAEKPARKITPEIAAQCRYERSNGLATIAELAARYGVKEGYMGNVVRGARGNGRTD